MFTPSPLRACPSASSTALRLAFRSSSAVREPGRSPAQYSRTLLVWGLILNMATPAELMSPLSSATAPAT